MLCSMCGLQLCTASSRVRALDVWILALVEYRESIIFSFMTARRERSRGRRR
jgi:hypothetical protein